jgi:hypothetical protein
MSTDEQLTSRNYYYPNITIGNLLLKNFRKNTIVHIDHALAKTTEKLSFMLYWKTNVKKSIIKVLENIVVEL